MFFMFTPTVTYVFHRRILLFAGLGIFSILNSATTVAASLNCARATSPTEKSICQHQELRALDARLSLAYSRIGSVDKQQRSTQRQAQLAWLKQRNICESDQACLSTRYQERIAVLGAAFKKATAYKPDDLDLAALEDLRHAVQVRQKIDPEFPVESVMAALAIHEGTSFSNKRDDENADGTATFPRIRPDGVTAGEWKALQASDIEGGGENGGASYTLIDLDGDGSRDLVIDSYVGGTGLFIYTSALRRVGPRFVGAYTVLQTREDKAPASRSDEGDAPSDQGSMYSINGRGANQSAHWIRLRGRVYAAYRNSTYGEEDIYLLRPLTKIGKVPKLTVRYRYRLSVPVLQPTGDGRGLEVRLDEVTHEALTRAVALVSPTEARDIGRADRPICPVPSGVEGDDRENYFDFGPGHYSFEIVGDMPVWIGRQCYIGRVMDWFGGYSPQGGLNAQIWVRKPETADEQKTYVINGKRAVEKIDTSIAPVEGDNGM